MSDYVIEHIAYCDICGWADTFAMASTARVRLIEHRKLAHPIARGDGETNAR